MLQTPTISVDAIDACVTAALADQRIPGISLAIGRAGTIAYAKGYGYRSLPYRVAPDEQTVYSIASISKQFTAAVIMRLVERGQLALDDPVRRYFQRLPDSANLQIHHLLEHTSGVPGFTEIPDFDQLCRTRATPDEVIETVTGRPPAFHPGAEWQYSNTNYVLLGRLIEQIAGAPYADVLQRELFDPFELATTGVDDVRRVRANAADPYTAYALGEFEHADEWDPSWEYGTGGLFSTAADLVRWNAALRGGRVVTPASYARMATSAALNDGTPTAYGFGLGVNDVDGVREVRHAGGLPGFTLENVTYPDLDCDIVVLTNRDGSGMNFSIVRPILAQLLERPELARFTPLASRPVTTTAQPPDPLVWVAAARDGRVDELGLSAGFRRFLTRERRRGLEGLRELGDLREATLVETARRDPYTYFTFRLAFEQRPLLGAIHLSDTGEVAHLAFTEWDQRPSA